MSFQPFLLQGVDLTSAHAVIRMRMIKSSSSADVNPERLAHCIERLSTDHEFNAIAWSEGKEIIVACKRTQVVKLFVFLRSQKEELGLQIEESLKKHVISPIPDGHLVNAIARAGTGKAMEEFGWERLSHQVFIRSLDPEHRWLDHREIEMEIQTCTVIAERTPQPTDLNLLIYDPSSMKYSPFPAATFAMSRSLMREKKLLPSKPGIALPDMRAVSVHDICTESGGDEIESQKAFWENQLLFDLPFDITHSLLVSYDDERCYEGEDEEGREGARVWIPSCLVLEPPGFIAASNISTSKIIAQSVLECVTSFAARHWSKSCASEPALDLTVPLHVNLGFSKAGDLGKSSGPLNLSRHMVKSCTTPVSNNNEPNDELPGLLLDIEIDEKPIGSIPLPRFLPAHRTSHLKPNHLAEKAAWPGLIKLIDGMIDDIGVKMDHQALAPPQKRMVRSLAPSLALGHGRKATQAPQPQKSKGAVMVEPSKRALETTATTHSSGLFLPAATSAPAPAAKKPRAKPADLDLNEVMKKVRDAHASGGLGKLKMDEMKLWCKENGLMVGGKKAELEGRIDTHLAVKAPK